MLDISHWELKLGDHERSQLQRETNKDYVAGYLMGRLSPRWIAKKDEDIETKGAKTK